jgi:hypothetical protein
MIIAVAMQEHFDEVLSALAQGWGPWRVTESGEAIRHASGYLVPITVGWAQAEFELATNHELTAADVGHGLEALKTCQYARWLEIGPWSTP